MIDTPLTSTLTNIGLDEKEARVYLALLELGSGTAAQIANTAEIKRPIVYHVVDRLKEKGYVSEIDNKKIRRFSASDPNKILHSVKNSFTDLKEMLPLMRALQNKGAQKPRIEFFDSTSAIISVFDMYTARMGNKSCDARFITSTEKLHQRIPHEVDTWVELYKKGKIVAPGKHLLSPTQRDVDWGNLVHEYGQDVRILPDNHHIDMDFAIVDDMLGITSFDPFFVVVIHSQTIAQSAAALFDLAWMQGKKLT